MWLHPKQKTYLSVGIILSAYTALFQFPAAHAETLQEALVSAYNSHPSLLAERARVREIDENYVQARAQGRLTSTIAGSLDYSVLRTPNANFQSPAASGSSTVDAVPKSVQLQVIQPLYQGGRIRALKSQAKSGIMAAREGLRSVEQNIFLNVATTYSHLSRDENAARIRRNNVRVLARQLQAATDRFDVGEGSRTDIAQAEARMAAAEIGLAQADAALQISRSSYTRAVGHPPSQLEDLPLFVIPDTLDAAINIARENNPQILAALLNEEAAGEAINVAKAASRPKISITGTASAVRDQLSLFQEAETAALAAQISIPIFSGGINRSRVRAAGHARTRSMFETRDTERAVDDAVTQVWAQLDAAKRTLVASQAQVKAAQFAFDGVELEQQLGTRSTLDVLNAEQELLESKLTVINAKAAVQTAEFQLLTAMGVFDAVSIRLAVDMYDPAENFETVRYSGMTKIIDKYVPEAAAKTSTKIGRAINAFEATVSDKMK